MMTTKRPSRLQQFVREALAAKGMTPHELARRLGWRDSRIYAMLGRNMRHRQLERILTMLGTTVQCNGISLELRDHADDRTTDRADV